MLINCAISHDRRLAGPGGAPVTLSDEEDLRRVHAMRAAMDAILVGAGTVVADDPSLRVKAPLAEGSDPVRVVLDSRLRCPATSRVFVSPPQTLLYHASKPEPRGDAELVQIPAGVGGLDLVAVLEDLASRGIESVMVEGGAAVIASFLSQGLWDEMTVYEAPVELGDGPAFPRPAQLREWGVFETAGLPQGEGWLRRFAPGR